MTKSPDLTVRWMTPFMVVVALMLAAGGVLLALTVPGASAEALTMAQVLPVAAGVALIAVAVLLALVDLLYRYHTERMLRQALVIDMAGPDSDRVHEAVRRLRAYGWLTDGSLRGADLWRANLSEAALYDADLRGARLTEANCEGSDLREANLEGVSLRDAVLQGAELGGACLCRATLEFARLQDATLLNANLERADLRHARLDGADLSYARLAHTNLSEASLAGADLSNAQMQSAQVTDAQLQQASSLWSAILPDGRRYDGRFALIGDTELARLGGIDTVDHEAMRRWYAGDSAGA
ncbi:MAG: pentapeptide repeat-containing protein [Anaerolineae bacterium]|nr:pentapeptide repeat-containing protein [Anaerolineae bacterium]